MVTKHFSLLLDRTGEPHVYRCGYNFFYQVVCAEAVAEFVMSYAAMPFPDTCKSKVTRLLAQHGHDSPTGQALWIA